MSIEEPQSAVAQLPAEELGRFSRWFEEFLAEKWDRQIEAGILAGRLDAAGRRADEEVGGGFMGHGFAFSVGCLVPGASSLL